MAQINIVIPLSNSDPNYIYSNVRYARIDNTVSPAYTQINNVTANPLVISNVANGQYRIFAQPFFSDGRICPEVMTETPPCTGITSFSAVNIEIEGNTLIQCTYTAEEGIDNVRITVNYPNGGFSTTIAAIGASPLNIDVPDDVLGTYFVTIQAVCDSDTGWFSVASPPVTVEIDASP